LRQKAVKAAVLLLPLIVGACQTPPVPSEVQQAATQEQDLWRAGGSLFAGPGYEAYRQALQRARRALEEENLKLGWFRDYDRVRAEFRQVLRTGRRLLADVQTLKQERLDGIARTLAEVRQRLADLSAITLSINERGIARQNLTRAEVMLGEAETFAGQSRFEEAKERLAAAEAGAREAEEAVVDFLGRYLDQSQLNAWQNLAEETVRESQLRRTTVIVVGKLERKLTVYQAGVPRLVCDIGLGFNGLADKLHAGDSATPEGRYRVIKKNPSSRFYKALLINYPNEDDRREFEALKKQGRIPSTVSIGGLVEIHGGGEDALTEGCISVANNAMDKIYALVPLGTSVTIVGTAERENRVLKAFQGR